AGLDFPAAELLLPDRLAEPRHHRWAGDEHRRTLRHHRIMARRQLRGAGAGDRAKPERDDGHLRQRRGHQVKALGLSHAAPPPGRSEAPVVSIVFPEPPPPEPSITRINGMRNSHAISSAIRRLPGIEASADPPRTVKSSATTTTGRPSTRPRPTTQFAAVRP